MTFYSDKNIFNSITEIDDEEINLGNNNNDDDDDDDDYDDDDDNNNDKNKTPSTTISVNHLLHKYVKIHNKSHVSVSTLLKIILKLNNDKKKDDDDDDDKDSYLHIYQLFLPKYSVSRTVSII